MPGKHTSRRTASGRSALSVSSAVSAVWAMTWLVADLVEELPEDLADCLIVVDDQYAHRVRRERLPFFQQSAYHW